MAEGMLTTRKELEAKGLRLEHGVVFDDWRSRDNARLAQMLANGGELEGIQSLQRKTVDPMMNHLRGMAWPTRGARTWTDSSWEGPRRSIQSRQAGPGALELFGKDCAVPMHFGIGRHEMLLFLLFEPWMPFDSEGLNLVETLVYQALKTENVE